MWAGAYAGGFSHVCWEESRQESGKTCKCGRKQKPSRIAGFLAIGDQFSSGTVPRRADSFKNRYGSWFNYWHCPTQGCAHEHLPRKITKPWIQVQMCTFLGLLVVVHLLFARPLEVYSQDSCFNPGWLKDFFFPGNQRGRLLFSVDSKPFSTTQLKGHSLRETLSNLPGPNALPIFLCALKVDLLL